jgi:predicted ATPase
MIDSFLIENFRLFDSLRIDRLARINLFVGRNNSGKSALLEAIEVYASNASAETLLNLIKAREETWNGKSQIEFRQLYGNPIRHIFRGHHLPKIGESGIILGPLNRPFDQINIVVAAFKLIIDEQGNRTRTLLQQWELWESDDSIELALTAKDGDKFRRIMNLDDDADRLRRRFSISWMIERYPIQSVPTRHMDARKVAMLWDLIGLTDLADEVISGIRLIDPSILGIQFVESTVSPRDERLPLVRTNLSSEPLPLRSMGDGITRLFHIILALVTAKDGILLVDEFENGLHWSVQSAVWKIIFRLAEHLNVQVFATTHSRDCINGFEDAWKENESLGAFFRLDADKQGQVQARTYSLDTLTDALDTVVEVR